MTYVYEILDKDDIQNVYDAFGKGSGDIFLNSKVSDITDDQLGYDIVQRALAKNVNNNDVTYNYTDDEVKDFILRMFNEQAYKNPEDFFAKFGNVLGDLDFSDIDIEDDDYPWQEAYVDRLLDDYGNNKHLWRVIADDTDNIGDDATTHINREEKYPTMGLPGDESWVTSNNELSANENLSKHVTDSIYGGNKDESTHQVIYTPKNEKENVLVDTEYDQTDRSAKDELKNFDMTGKGGEEHKHKLDPALLNDLKSRAADGFDANVGAVVDPVEKAALDDVNNNKIDNREWRNLIGYLSKIKY